MLYSSAFLRRTQQAAKSDPHLAEFLRNYDASVFDWGDDPAFYSAQHRFGDVRNASWGVFVDRMSGGCSSLVTSLFSLRPGAAGPTAKAAARIFCFMKTPASRGPVLVSGQNEPGTVAPRLPRIRPCVPFFHKKESRHPRTVPKTQLSSR